MQTQQWSVFETALESTRRYDEPFRDARVRVRFTSRSGERHAVDAFWDGNQTWRVRFCPTETGEWSWESECSEAGDRGLHNRRGGFRCVPYSGGNSLYRHGPLRLSGESRSFEHADGTPFFWLGDTAWNGALRSQEKDWERYLRLRQEQGFTAVQFVSTHWRACSADPRGETAFDRGLRINPEFFRRLDRKVVAINECGLVAAPVIMWSFDERDPGRALSEADAVLLARYLIARWGAHHVVWILGGDGDYQNEHAERWKRIGRAAFDRHDRLATMHPQGLNWVAEEFRHEDWFDCIGYQSGHGDAPDHLRWLTEGPPASDWETEPPLPVINLEPNYEGHPSYHSETVYTDVEIRRASYWSLLVSPTAGVTFGHNAIWNWSEAPEVPEGHARLGTVAPWHEGLDTPGTRSMSVLRQFLDALDWPRLRPAPELLRRQPGEHDPRKFIAAAKRDDGKLAVGYLPEGGSVELQTDSLKTPAAVRWFAPRTGDWTSAGQLTAVTQTFTAPTNGDWLLCIGENT